MNVVIEGLYSSLPPAGVPGRIFFTLDTKTYYSDNGEGWTEVPRVPAAFVGDSGSGGAAGAVPAPEPGDAAAGKFLYAGGGFAIPPGADPVNVSLAPEAPGPFTVAHGLGRAPKAVLISMTSSFQIWLQSPTGYDATNLYLVASDAGATANAVCF
ncbi:MAG TPA: hypothetical protein VGT04_07015 [Acidobacteriaceae bacterium]|nr:hypothetical protein [Acidobacteriaceae bacterium]